MRLRGEFTVAAPLASTWETLLDVDRVASCLPGVTFEPVGEDGTYRASARIHIGTVGASYAGTVRLTDVDADRHVASFAARANETPGTGTARAVIHHHAGPSGDGTRVVVHTDLHLTGRAAHLEPRLIEGIAQRYLEDFAVRLEPLVLEDLPRESPSRRRLVRPGPAGLAVAGGVAALVLLVASARWRRWRGVSRRFGL